MSRGAIFCDALREYDRAISDFTRAIELEPRNPFAYKNRGVARNLRGDVEGAIEDYTQAIDLNPRYAVAYTNRGVIRASQGNFRAAIADYEKALRVAPKNWSYRKMVEKNLARARKKQAAGDK